MRRLTPLILAALCASISAHAQPCSPGWALQFGEGTPALSPFPSAAVGGSVVAFDADGPGPAATKLVYGGYARRPDGTFAPFVTSWDGSRWTPMNAGLPTYLIHSLCVLHNPTTGAQTLYASADAEYPVFLRWNGAAWTTLPSPSLMFAHSFQLTAFDPDGAGPLPETIIGVGLQAFYPVPLFSWDGAAWITLPFQIQGGFGDNHGFATYTPPGGTPHLCITSYSYFSQAGFSQADYVIDTWDGTTRGTLAHESCTYCNVTYFSTLDVLNDLPGGGSSLFVRGLFPGVGGVSSQNIARWDGQAWHAADAGLPAPKKIYALGVVPTSSGPVLLADAATQTSPSGPTSTFRWNGSSWSGPLTSFDAPIGQLIPFNDGVDSLFAVGSFTIAGNVYATHLARTIGPLDLNGPNTIWAPVGQSLNNSVHALAGLPSASGSLSAGLYAGGAFYTAGSSLAVSIARWDGASWSPLGVGANNHVDALTIASISGPASLFAGGKFTSAGGVNAPHIARWNGAAWFPLAASLNDRVESLATFNNTLIAGGAFSASGTTSLQHIARWDGTAWSPLTTGTDGDVQALTVFNDGATTALYVGGSFSIAGGIPAAHIAKWNGSAWSTLGAGFDGPVLALASFDDGSGAALYAAGNFSHSGATPMANIAKWNGST